MSRSKMEAELKCPKCDDWFKGPLLLPCCHSVCGSCAISSMISPEDALRLQQKQQCDVIGQHASDHESYDDRISVFSEADSGVVVGSKNGSSVGGASGGPISQAPLPAPLCLHVTNRPSHFAIVCVVCARITMLDDRGAECLIANRALENVVSRFLTKMTPTQSPVKQSSPILCNLCEEGRAEPASMMCEQCEVYYCRGCCERCHPQRGPLAKHTLHEAALGKDILQQKQQQKKTRCRLHLQEDLSIYCATCRTVVCCLCMQDAHFKHDLHQLNAICKSQKTELSQLLQCLSEKAKTGTYFIQNLKSLSEKINRNFPKKEEEIIAQIENIIRLLEQKKIELTNALKMEKERKTAKFKDHIHQSTLALGKANGLLQFCIEMLKESDPTAFLLVSHSLIAKVSSAEQAFLQEVELKPRTSTDFDLKLSNIDVLRSAVSNLRLTESQASQYSGSLGSVSFDSEAPNAPIIWREQCRVESNIITVVWQPYPGPPVECYTLEIDDGLNGNFRKVYRGCESICTVEGLHFRSFYRIRVKAHNRHGDSNYSDMICLQTSSTTWFCMDPKSTKNDVFFSNDNRILTTDSVENRTVLATTSLSRGVHYWEFIIDRIEPGGQPSFGIAKADCNKEMMLGKDNLGWAMYIDFKRSWFIHNNDHFERTDGGVKSGFVIGIRLDCDKGNLSYYINDEPHGPISFTKLKGSHYPAVSFNKFVQLTLVVGKEVPSESEDSEEDDRSPGAKAQKPEFQKSA